MIDGIENVVFDMGGVLLQFDGMLFAREYCSTEEDARLLADAFFCAPEWPLLDAGAINESTMERIARGRLPERLHATLHECARTWDSHQPAIPETSEVARHLHDAGLDLYVLSNAGIRFERQKHRIPAYPLFSGTVCSAFEHLMKPDPLIYQLLCDRFELRPETCLFVDDNPANVEGAEVAGMRGYVFDGDASALEGYVLG